MKKHCAFAVFVGVLIAITSATGYAKSSKEKNATSAASGPQTKEFIATAKDRISKCESEFSKYESTSWAAEKAWDAAYSAAEATSRLTGKPVVNPEMSKVELYHKACADNAKNELVPVSKGLFKSIKNTDAQNSAKDMMAQWITAIDAIGSQGSRAESAKFETLANRLLLDL